MGLASIAVATAFGAAGCSSANHAGGSGIVTNGAYVQQPAKLGQTTVGYLDIRNNGAADELISVSTSVGGTVELRGPVTKGVSPVVMHTVKDIPIPSDATTQLIPNSYHLLITNPGAMHDGKDIYLKLTFAHGGTMTVIALVTNPQNGGSSYFLN
jgi:copper(I)-binding protein